MGTIVNSIIVQTIIQYYVKSLLRPKKINKLKNIFIRSTEKDLVPAREARIKREALPFFLGKTNKKERETNFSLSLISNSLPFPFVFSSHLNLVSEIASRGGVCVDIETKNEEKKNGCSNGIDEENASEALRNCSLRSSYSLTPPLLRSTVPD